MRIALVLGVIGQLLRLFSVAYLPPIALALYDHEWWAAGHFLVALVSSYVVGWRLGLLFEHKPVFQRAEAFAVVAGTWLFVGHFGAIPYVGEGLSPVDALFESISGFTTTGATILTDFSRYGRAFYLWRAMTQWFGGLGVIALFVLVLPRLGIAGRQLFFAEATGPASEAITPRIRETALRLWMLYIGLTALQIALLHKLAGMALFDAICNSFTTLAAGGFSPNPSSIAGYQNPTAEWIFVVFMMVGGTSFTLQWKAISGRPQALILDGEFLAFLIAACIGAYGAAAVISGGVPGLDALRAGAFQSASLISSTGFASVDYNKWSDGAKACLVFVMLVGGCAGSAAGGVKVVRLLLVGKFLRREVTQVLHPHAVLPVRHANRQVSEPILRSVVTLVGLYMGLLVFIGIAVVLLGADLVTGFSAALACLGNIGPGFGTIGPMDNFAGLATTSKLILTWAMLVGRLEIVTVLALLHPDVWRNLHWRGRR